MRTSRLACLLVPLALVGSGGCAATLDDMSSRTWRSEFVAHPFQAMFVSPDPLVVLRDSQDGDARARAIKRLSEPGTHDSARQDAIVSLLASAATTEPDPYCRLAAIERLGSFKDPRAGTALVAAWRGLEAEQARAAAPPDNPAELLKRKQYQPDRLACPPETITMIQTRALDALARSGRPEGVAVLSEVAARQPAASAGEAEKARSHTLKLAAVRGLGASKDPKASVALVAVLQEAKDGKDVDLRTRTVAALKSVTGKDHGADAQAWAGYLRTQGLDAGGPPSPTAIPDPNPIRTVGHNR